MDILPLPTSPSKVVHENDVGFPLCCTSSQWFSRKVAAPQSVWSLCLWRINLAQLHTNEVQPVGYMTLSYQGEVGTANPHSLLFIIQRDIIIHEAMKKLGGYHEREYMVQKEVINIQDAAEICLMQLPLHENCHIPSLFRIYAASSPLLFPPILIIPLNRPPMPPTWTQPFYSSQRKWHVAHSTPHCHKVASDPLYQFKVVDDVWMTVLLRGVQRSTKEIPRTEGRSLEASWEQGIDNASRRWRCH